MAGGRLAGQARASAQHSHRAQKQPFAGLHTCYELQRCRAGPRAICSPVCLAGSGATRRSEKSLDSRSRTAPSASAQSIEAGTHLEVQDPCSTQRQAASRLRMPAWLGAALSAAMLLAAASPDAATAAKLPIPPEVTKPCELTALPNGVKYCDLKEGTGTSPYSGTFVKAHYVATLASTGAYTLRYALLNATSGFQGFDCIAVELLLPARVAPSRQ